MGSAPWPNRPSAITDQRAITNESRSAIGIAQPPRCVRRSPTPAVLARGDARLRAARGPAADGARRRRGIEDGGTLLAEAGTGTGKTLAYLIPAILSRQRVLVSTGTKNLQEQIFFKDLPSLRESLGVPFTATLMKGRSNYLCLHRWETYRDAVEGNTSDERPTRSTSAITCCCRSSRSGRDDDDRRSRRAARPAGGPPLWKEISAEADTCLGTECPRYGDCFVTLMRQRAAESDVVIVNHHLLCADASVRQSAFGEVIPSCPTLVVDEAHQLEDVATQYFGVSFSNFRVDDLVRDAERLLATARREIERTEDGRASADARHRRARDLLRRLSLARAARWATEHACATPPRRWPRLAEDG